MAFLSIFKTIMLSFTKEPATIKYPFAPKVSDPNVRGHVEVEIDKCIFCGICQKKCPTRAITVIKDATTWEIERLSCIQCNCCVEVCPKKCLLMSDVLPPAAASITNDVVKKDA